MQDISELLQCRYPIIQGAMGVISNPEMVAAVSEAGGYGLLATGSIRDQTGNLRPPQSGSLQEAWLEGKLDANVLASGQIAGMIRSVQSVQEIIAGMVKAEQSF